MVAGREDGQIAVAKVGYVRVSTRTQRSSSTPSRRRGASRSLKTAPQERELTVLV
jgi:hypothetical protein